MKYCINGMSDDKDAQGKGNLVMILCSEYKNTIQTAIYILPYPQEQHTIINDSTRKKLHNGKNMTLWNKICLPRYLYNL